MQDLTSYVDALVDRAEALPSVVEDSSRPRVPLVEDGVAQSTRRRSPVTVGRDPVVAAGEQLLDDRHGGRPHPALCLVGPSGHGKSRLLHDLRERARARGFVVASGRAVPGARSSPYRCLAEASARFVREHDLHPDGDLLPYAAALRRLVPAWEVPGERTAIPALVMAEALTTLLGRAPGPALLVLDDLQWADEETLAVVEALCEGHGVATVLATRPGGVAEGLVAALEAREAVRVWSLGPLPGPASARLAEAVAGGTLPPAVTQELHDRSGGVPLVVEELVNALMAAGVLEPAGDGHLEARDPAAVFEHVPGSLQAAVGRAVESLSGPARAVVRAAAVLGREAPLPYVATVAEVPPPAVAAAVRELVSGQLVEHVRRPDGDALRFVHALNRDAVVAQLAGVELRALAERALRDHGPDAAGLEQRAGLALIAGQPELARDLFAEVGRRAQEQGALASAERALERAVAVRGVDTTEVSARLVELLALAGRNERAAELAGRALGRADGDVAGRLHLTLARVEEVQGREEAAAGHLAAAAALRPDHDPEVALVRSRLALARHDVEEARSAAESGLRRHVTVDQACEALELLGRCARTDDEALSEQLLAQMARLAEAHGRLGWRLRALSELGILDVFRLGGPDRLLAAQATARARGDLVTAAMVGYHEAVRRFHVLEDRDWQGWLDATEREARTYGLAPVAGACEVLRVGFGLLTGDRQVASELADRLDASDLDRERRAALWGIGRTTEALLVDDLDRALAAATYAVGPVAERGGDPSPTWGTWAFLEAVHGRYDAAEEIRRRGTTINRINAGLARWADALRHAEQGRTEEAAGAADEAVALLAPAPWYAALALRHAWPRGEALAWSATVTDAAHEAVGVCRARGWTGPGAALARALGVPWTARADNPWGLTVRESEILEHVAAGRSNGEIAQALVISPRTVEKHVEKLLHKTGAPSRVRLALLARPRDGA